MGPDRFHAVDAELAAFRVSDERIVRVVDAALRTVADMGGVLAAYSTLGDAPTPSTHTEAPPLVKSGYPPPPPRGRTEPPPRGRTEPPPRTRTEPPPRARTEPPPSVAPRRSAPPPAAIPPRESTRPPPKPAMPFSVPPLPSFPELEDEPLFADAPIHNDISGLSVDDLFADSEPTTSAPMPGDGNLASLFDDEPAHFDDAEAPGSLADALADSPAEKNPFEMPTSDLEVLIDDDVLVLEDGEAEGEEHEAPPQGPREEAEPPKKGLLTRLFGERK